MREDGWRVDRTAPRAAPKASYNPAKNYSHPEISKVSVFLEADEDAFVPLPAGVDGSAFISANIPSESLSIPRGGSVIVDCGFAVTLPPGYRCRVSSSVPGILLDIVESKRFKVNAVNLGDETTLKDRETIGRLWVEPVYFFEWITRF